MNKTRRFIPVMMLAMIILLAACSNKTNTARSRFWQSFTTKYNVYFHGKTNYDEQEKAMLTAYEDDYSQRLFMHPAEARSNPKAPQPTGSFERTIEKMEKAITLHSIKKKPKRKSGKNRDPKYREWLARDEYNPFLHNAWYLLAKSQYMKGDFLDAAATFRYIARHFTWKTDLVQECQVREALCYCAMGWPTEADNVLAHVHMDEITNKRVRALANAAFADYYIKAQRPEEAIPYLAKAVKGFKGNEKVRMNFLLGQLYEEVGDKHNAYLAYKQAGSSSGSTYRTKFNARIKQSAVYEGANIASEVRALKRMTRYDRNKDYLDQIYYAIGNLYLTHGDTLSAIENYRLAAKKSTRNGVDKAISQLTLGGIYFNRRQYDEAQVCYAEAIPLVNEDYPNYNMLKKRSDVLDELAVYSQNVTLQDSLLRLSAMTPEEQKAVIAKIIEELKKKEKEEAENAAREEYLAQQNAKGSQLKDNKNDPASYNINTDNSWYFYNTATKNAGKTQFQKQWGSRKLEDNWRRRIKTTFSFDDEETDSAMLALADSMVVNENGDTVKVDVEALKRAEDPHYEEYYLKQIPKTEEEIQSAHEIIQEGLYNMGTILKDKMEDYNAAAYEYNQLLEHYPDNTYRLDVYYSMYMMYMRNGQVADAEPYRDSILIHFPDSKYGQAMQDPNYLENLKNMTRDQENMYEAAYAEYLANNHNGVHDAYAEMMRKYPLSKIMPKFMFIDALSYLTEKNYDKFKETLKDMLQRYPQTDITPTASEIIKQLNQGRRLEGGGSNVRGMLWTTRLSNDTTPQAIERTFTPFAEDNDKPQVFILLYPIDSINSNMLLYEVARHNFNSFQVKDYDIEQMNFGTLGLLVVKGLDNFKEAINYRSVFENDQSINIPRQVHYVIISVDNFNLLLNEGRTFEDYFNYLQEKNDKEHSDLEKKELDEAEKKAMEEAEREAAAEREKARIEAERIEREAAELAKRDAEEKAKEIAEEKARLEAEAAEQARIEAEEKARQEAERKQIKASDYRNNSTATSPQKTLTDKELKAQERAEEEHLKQLEREAKAREKAERKRQKEIDDSIKKEQKHQRKLARIQEIAEQDSIEQAEREKEKERDFRYKWREDSAKAAYKAAEQAKKDAKKAKEQARKEKAKERKELAKQREKERKEKAKERERERKEKAKERKEQAKAREQERKERQKERERERKERAEQRKQEARDRENQRKEQAAQRKAEANDKSNSQGKSTDSTSPDNNGDDNDPSQHSVRPNKKNN
ncbi:MAG: tetratricopeptide repeat protein [Bacteroidales bacterium]|nr:tetratricopeptide repeat protein [Bacteroidales bacterium]